MFGQAGQVPQTTEASDADELSMSSSYALAQVPSALCPERVGGAGSSTGAEVHPMLSEQPDSLLMLWRSCSIPDGACRHGAAGALLLRVLLEMAALLAAQPRGRDCRIIFWAVWRGIERGSTEPSQHSAKLTDCNLVLMPKPGKRFHSVSRTLPPR